MLRTLYSQYLKLNYPDKIFSLGKFSKKGRKSFENVGLTTSEQQKRDDFYSFAEEIAQQLNINNIKESIDLLELYFDDVMA